MCATRPSSAPPQRLGGIADAAGETSPAVRDIVTQSLDAISGDPRQRRRRSRRAAAAGAWTIRASAVSRARLEPYFRLHREAHLNIIRNWLGQNTEDVFYDLADEYGLLVLNDFWESTQDFQLEPRIRRCFSPMPRCHQPLSQSSVDCRLVRPQRRRAATDPERRPGRSGGAPSTARATTPAVPTASTCRTAAPTTIGRPRAISPAGARASRSRSARRRCHDRVRLRASIPAAGPLAAQRYLRLSRLAFRRQRRCRDLHAALAEQFGAPRASRTSSARRS
jgi:hypothetical protein